MTLEGFKMRALAAIASANDGHGADNEITGLREAIEALPDRRLLAGLPADVRQFIERELGKIPNA